MKLLFNLGLTLLLVYLVANAAMSSVEGVRPVIQLIARMGVFVMLGYSIAKFVIYRWPAAKKFLYGN